MAIDFGASAFADGPVPVVPSKDQPALLQSHDPKLAYNKRLAYDFYRVVLTGLHLDQVSRFMREDYIQHNPNVDTGMSGFLRYFSHRGGPISIPAEVPDLVSIQAEGDLVTFSFVNEQVDKNNPARKYSTTWFDMFRIQAGKIAEHWDCALQRR
jgi:predicted SnoaL-like aldol condensation-catalyzing enzyme